MGDNLPTSKMGSKGENYRICKIEVSIGAHGVTGGQAEGLVARRDLRSTPPLPKSTIQILLSQMSA